MKKLIALLLGFSCCYVNCFGTGWTKPDSTTAGIHFQAGLSWKEILSKAKNEHKFIFVDCYATWCVPCNEMEKEIYPLEKVSAIYNQFVCVKYQMDSTKRDNEAIKNAYPDVAYINQHYHIHLFPTFFIFDSDGNQIANSYGKMDADQFIQFAKKSTDPSNSYIQLIQVFKTGKADLSQLSKLAMTSVSVGDTLLSEQIQHDYLRKLTRRDWFNQYNINFMQTFSRSVRDPGFSLFYRHTAEVNRVMKDDGYAQGIVAGIIGNEFELPSLEQCEKNKTNPNWRQLSEQIRRKFNPYYAERITIGLKASWYGFQRKWELWTKYRIEFEEKYAVNTQSGHWVALNLNNLAWAIFQRSNDKATLQKALKWSEKAVLMDPNSNWMDTYANILYKLGEKELAITWEEFALKNGSDPEILAVYKKMKAGEPTWPQTDKDIN
jgi:thioredoxin-related protein